MESLKPLHSNGQIGINPGAPSHATRERRHVGDARAYSEEIRPVRRGVDVLSGYFVATSRPSTRRCCVQVHPRIAQARTCLSSDFPERSGVSDETDFIFKVDAK
jgi:hypothetical protein